MCGERAVRVDILERLADLIRPAIAYRPGTTAGRSAARRTADGDGFVVTVGMTSLAGCSAEAFGSVLKSLGYVLDRRPGPAITVPLVPKAPTAPIPGSRRGGERSAGGGTATHLRGGRAGGICRYSSMRTTAHVASRRCAGSLRSDDLESRVSLARQSELIAAALEGGALDAIEPLPTAARQPCIRRYGDASPSDAEVTIALADGCDALIRPPRSDEPCRCGGGRPWIAHQAPVDSTRYAQEHAADLVNRHGSTRMPFEPDPAEHAPAAGAAGSIEGVLEDAPPQPAETAAAFEVPADDAMRRTPPPRRRRTEPAEIPLIEIWRPHRHNVHNNRRPAENSANVARVAITAASRKRRAQVEGNADQRQPPARTPPPKTQPARPDGGNRRDRFRDVKTPRWAHAVRQADVRSGAAASVLPEVRGADEGEATGVANRGAVARGRHAVTSVAAPSFQTTEAPRPAGTSARSKLAVRQARGA